MVPRLWTLGFSDDIGTKFTQMVTPQQRAPVTFFIFAPREERPSTVVVAEQADLKPKSRGKHTGFELDDRRLYCILAMTKTISSLYFTERALSVIKDKLKLDEAPPILSEHPSLFDSELLKPAI